MEPVERIERAPDDDARESDDEEADHDEDLAASLEYEGANLSLSASCAPLNLSQI